MFVYCVDSDDKMSRDDKTVDDIRAAIQQRTSINACMADMSEAASVRFVDGVPAMGRVIRRAASMRARNSTD